MSVHLIGGGWAEDEQAWTGRFIQEARERAETAPLIVCVLWAETLEEGESLHADYREDFGKFDIGELRIVQLTGARALEAADLAAADGIFVGGGLTPGYHAAIMPLADTIRGLVASGVPYAGFSAGAMIAGEAALLGGWRIGGIEVIAHEYSEGLDEVSLDAGLALVDLVVDVHAAQSGTLSRAVGMVDAGLAERAVAIDECTSLIVGSSIQVAGRGNVWVVSGTEDGVNVRVLAQQAQAIDE